MAAEKNWERVVELIDKMEELMSEIKLMQDVEQKHFDILDKTDKESIRGRALEDFIYWLGDAYYELDSTVRDCLDYAYKFCWMVDQIDYWGSDKDKQIRESISKGEAE